MRAPCAVLLALVACTREVHRSSRPIVRLSATDGDTIVVNNIQPKRLPVNALDVAGRTVDSAPLRFVREGGDTLALTSSGVMTCAERGDVLVRASLGSLHARVLVRCRPVEYLRLQGPLQFVLGDSALGKPMPLPIDAYDARGRPVVLIAGYADTGDSSVAVLRGLTLVPRSRGISGAFVRVGDRKAMTGVHVYQRVETLAALDTALRIEPEQRLLAIPLQLQRGEYYKQRLPHGSWMLAMLPEEEHTGDGIRLRVEGADCTPNFLNTPRRFGCHAGPNATVIIYRPPGAVRSQEARANLLVRWLFT